MQGCGVHGKDRGIGGRLECRAVGCMGRIGK